MTDDLGRDAKNEGIAASEEDAEAVAYYDNLGPWVRQALVRETLGLTDEELAEMRDSHGILGVEFGGQYYYPAWLFAGGNVVDGLGRVLDALSAGFSSAEAQVAWLAEPAFEGEPEHGGRHSDAARLKRWSAGVPPMPQQPPVRNPWRGQDGRFLIAHGRWEKPHSMRFLDSSESMHRRAVE